MQASELGARGLSQQFESPPPQSSTLSQPIPLTDDRNASSSFLSISSILNGPAPATTSSERNPSGAISATEGCAETFRQLSPGILIPKSSSRATRIQRAANQGDIDAKFPIPPESDQAYTANQRPLVPLEVHQLPTPPAQSHEQYYEFLSAPRPATDHLHSSEGLTKASVKIPLLQSGSPSISASLHDPSSCQTSPTSLLYGKIGQPLQTSTLHDPGDSFGRTAEGGVVSFQATPEASGDSYNALSTHYQQSSFSFSSTCSLGQTSPSDPDPVLTLITSQGSYQVPVDVHKASWKADEKRARNAGASARFRQRRKEKEKEANSNIEKLQQQARELERKAREVEQERDFYRAERDRFRDVVYRTPDMRHLVMQAPPSPQSMRPGSFQGSMSQMGNPPPPHPPPQMGFQAPQSTSERAPIRRRTDAQGNFTSLPPYTLPPASTLPPVQAPGYPPGPGQGPTSLPPLRIENTAAPLTTSSNIPSATTAGPPHFDPYSRSPYERGWPGEGGRR
jgi:hypothetical protein